MKHLICIVFVRQHLICSMDMTWTSHLILWRIRTSHMLSFRIGNISNGMFPIKSISYVLSWNFGHLTCSFFQKETSHLYWNAKNTSQMVVFALWTSHMMRSAGMNISFVINPYKKRLIRTRTGLVPRIENAARCTYWQHAAPIVELCTLHLLLSYVGRRTWVASNRELLATHKLDTLSAQRAEQLSCAMCLQLDKGCRSKPR